jgi:hypothetical protein
MLAGYPFESNDQAIAKRSRINQYISGTTAGPPRRH